MRALIGLLLIFSLNAGAEPRWHCGEISEIDHPVYAVEIVQQGFGKTARAFLVPASTMAAEQLQRLLQNGRAMGCVLGEVERTDDGNLIPFEGVRTRQEKSGIGVTIE